ncbi:MBL fold metallo-hydrolase [Tuberibacillus sp. Marseille-P3662]|uniref:MBL fold metallo-hydrolase n=1 Tax=Tuberibacillus sp. Marseille-P3662 TaxID=1965358 RepID=UPI0015947AB5|nr:MBL fold metallo-hydrolase [Tuberibacillus sp. Marseille-P3662]
MTAIHQVTDGIWQITLPTPFKIGPVNVYLIHTDRWTLVDAGVKTKEAEQLLTESLSVLGLTLRDIQQVVLTHHHPDHIGLTHLFQEHAAIMGHPRVEPWLSKDTRFTARYEMFFDQLYREMGVPEAYRDKVPTLKDYYHYTSTGTLDVTIDAGDTIEGLDEWRLIYTPGHAQSHLSLIREADGVLLGGDVLLEHVSSNAIVEPPYHDEESEPLTLLQYRKTMQALLDEPFNLTLPGHGEPFYNGKKLIDQRLHRQKERKDKIFNQIASEGSSTFALGKALFSRVYESQLDLVMSEVHGFLKWLEVDEQVSTVLNDGIVYYKQK